MKRPVCRLAAATLALLAPAAAWAGPSEVAEPDSTPSSQLAQVTTGAIDPLHCPLGLTTVRLGDGVAAALNDASQEYYGLGWVSAPVALPDGGVLVAYAGTASHEVQIYSQRWSPDGVLGPPQLLRHDPNVRGLALVGSGAGALLAWTVITL